MGRDVGKRWLPDRKYIVVECPGCKRAIQVDRDIEDSGFSYLESAMGEQFECPECTAPFHVTSKHMFGFIRN